MVDLRRLRAFVATVEEANVTRAADRLGMQQPPLTRLLRALETELGAVLLHRSSRGVKPTRAGDALFQEAQAILMRADGVTEAVRRAVRGEEGRLAVGFTSSAALHPFVPAAFRAFREALPSVRVDLEEAGTAELVEAVLKGRLDAAFVRSPVGLVPELAVDPVLQEPMLAALPARHRLLARPRRLALTALAAEPFVLYRRPSGPGLYDAILAACREAGFSPVVAQEAPRLTATLSLVAAGLGVTLVPASLQRIAIEGVAYRPLARGPVAPIHLALRRHGVSPTATRFRTLVGDLAQGKWQRSGSGR
jgi:DNA-binding transcriptional LysR family regulator